MPRWPRLAVAAGVLATLAGIFATGLWRTLPVERALLSLVLIGTVSALAWPLRQLFRVSQATVVAVLWVMALLLYVGPLAGVAAILLAAGGLALGSWLVPAGVPARTMLATVTGMCAIALLAGWTVTWPIHTWWTWCLLLCGLIALRRRALAEVCADAMDAWHAHVEAAPRAAGWATMLLGLASVACWIPALQTDDLGYHFNLPMQWLLHARYAPDPEAQVWSYAPWAGDVLQAIGFVLSRGDAHGATDALWIALGASGLFAIAELRGAQPREQWSAVALFGAFPPLVWMAAGMQTELPAIAITAALLATILAPQDAPQRDRAVRAASPGHRMPWRLIAGTLLLAALFALKLMHGVVALPFVLYAGWRHRGTRAWRWWPAAALLFLALASASYAQAWRATGNPLLPMFNQVFRSPYFPAEQLHDPRWFAGFGADILWRITFDTDRYVEGFDGGFGFTLIALAGLWLLQLLRPGHRALTWTASIALLLPLLPMQYARYAWPGVALLGALLPLGAETALGRRVFVWLIAGTCALNLAYQANASWLHHSAALNRTIRSGADPESVLAPYAPERLLLHAIPGDDAQRVLATDPLRDMVAELAGRGRTVSIHAPALHSAFLLAERDVGGSGWAALLRRERIRWVLVNRATASTALRAGLSRVEAREVDTIHDVELWSIPERAQ